MTPIFSAEYNTRCYGKTFRIIVCIKAQKLEDTSNDEKMYRLLNLYKYF